MLHLPSWRWMHGFLATFAPACVSCRTYVRYTSCMNNPEIKHQSNVITVHTVGLRFTAQACRTELAPVLRRVKGATNSWGVQRKSEAKQTLERLRATSNLWSELCQKLKHTADIWAEALQSWTQLRLHFRCFKCIDLWTHTFSHSYLWGDLLYVTLLLYPSLTN